MQTTAHHPIRINDKIEIPDGNYEGTWGGYQVTFKVGNTIHRATTNLGIRTPAAPVIVTALNQTITVTLKKEQTDA